jgi:DnaJ-class molecular chaperone
MRKTVILCSKCEGAGYIRCSELTDYHKGEYDDWIEKCFTCEGSGRMVEIVTVKLEPYIPARDGDLGRK